MKKKKEVKRKIKCSHCGYPWETKSKKQYVSCPDCLQKVKRVEENNGL